MNRLTLTYVWKQKQIPVVLRRTGRGERLRVRLPFADDNRKWMQNGRRTVPEWIGGIDVYWELPKSWFNDFVDRALVRGVGRYVDRPLPLITLVLVALFVWIGAASERGMVEAKASLDGVRVEAAMQRVG